VWLAGGSVVGEFRETAGGNGRRDIGIPRVIILSKGVSKRGGIPVSSMKSANVDCVERENG